MIDTNSVILSFAEADREGIGNKARQLARLTKCQPGLFSIPPGLVLLPSFSIDIHRQELINKLSRIAKAPLAVRSCSLAEDGSNESMAGKFHTELFVPLENIANAIAKVRASYGNSIETGAVLIQQMIKPDYAGVIFTRSPENYGLASCEYAQGTADAVVSGKVEPTRVDYGRWSGTLYPPQQETSEMLSLLFLVGMIIEEKMGVPQDIEWAYDKKQSKVYILQSRDITSHLYEPGIADEQAKAASFAVTTRNSQKGKTVFKNTAVREVVSSPTRLTRSLMERLYAPTGALGKALGLLGLPCPKINAPYVLSVFGQLYTNVEVENKLFGLRPKMLWASRILKKKIQKNPKKLEKWLIESIDKIPCQSKIIEKKRPIEDYARAVIAGMRIFIEEVYPVAYTATLLAQMTDEETHQTSLTSKLMRDLSRLHHTGEIDEFITQWGNRSANDYELSEPRFCESPEQALIYAANFANFPWGEVAAGGGFTHLKELTKDISVRWLYSLRQNILGLEQALQLEQGLVFYLAMEDIETLADDKLANGDITSLVKKRVHDEAQWSMITFGDEITLEALECLEGIREVKQGLRGKMVAARKPFHGKVRLVDSINDSDLKANVVMLAKHLEPRLVGYFPTTVACLVDIGGTLSHAAIVARELGYPVLVLPGSTSTIRDGDQIDVSFDGVVTVSREKPFKTQQQSPQQ